MKKVIFILIVITLIFLSFRSKPEKIDYGVSFSAFHAQELNLNWQKTFDAIVHDLGVRRFRFSAHWPLTEPEKDKFDWTYLDYQINEAEKTGSTVILAVGQRLPGWPECHVPGWAQKLTKEEQQAEMLGYIRAVVERYGNARSITHWQVENEPYLTLFAKHICGNLDEEFLKKEIALVESLDPDRPIIVTDSGEISFWWKPYKLSDTFGTTLYLYVWNHKFGPIRYPVIPAFFRIKRNIVELAAGDKPVFLIELGAEPWLTKPIVETPLKEVLARMDIEKFNKVIKFAKKAGFETQYLWGAEWWYYMKEKNHPEFWNRAKELFSESSQK